MAVGSLLAGAFTRLVFGQVMRSTSLVEDDLMTPDDFKAFTFDNTVRLFAEANPNFFDGTSVATEAAAALPM